MFFEFVEYSIVGEVLSVEKQFDWRDIVVNSGTGVVSHVEAFSYFFYGEDANIHGEVGIDVSGYFLQVKDSVLPINNIATV